MAANESIQEHEQKIKRNDFLQVVSFKLHKEEYAIEITKAKEIILLEGITKVPQMPDFIEGIINLRGEVIPVLDLRKRLQLHCTEMGEHTRIVVVRMGTRIMGLIVDSVSQVMKIPKSEIKEPPETIAGLAGDYLIGVGKVNERLILLLDIDKVISAGEHAQLTRAELPETVEVM
jgi:purine-binding chemotaxis protein CheW